MPSLQLQSRGCGPTSRRMRITALCGGVGGAKLALGLQRVTSELSLIVNTGDDFVCKGLPICPDIDTVLYTLSGQANLAQGWGRAEESFAVQEEWRALGDDAWFTLGDRDIALHLLRLGALSDGQGLAQVTADLARRLGVAAQVVPMSEASCPTVIETDEGQLSFQDYFVRLRCVPRVTGIVFGGAGQPGGYGGAQGPRTRRSAHHLPLEPVAQHCPDPRDRLDRHSFAEPPRSRSRRSSPAARSRARLPKSSLSLSSRSARSRLRGSMRDSSTSLSSTVTTRRRCRPSPRSAYAPWSRRR